MPATLLDGKALAKQIQSELAEEVIDFIQNNATVPCLAAVLVGEDPASEVYVRNKRRDCERVGIDSQLHRLPADASEDELLSDHRETEQGSRRTWNPRATSCSTTNRQERVLQAINPAKDVDAFHPENVGRLVQGRPRFLPCTPHGIQQLLIRNALRSLVAAW